MNLHQRRELLEGLYDRLNRRGFVHPDPLEFLYRYEDPKDRELVALVASSLAYGRVAQILKSVQTVLNVMGKSPAEFILSVKPGKLRASLEGFKHRFNTHHHMVEMLLGVRKILKTHNSLGELFSQCISPEDKTVLPALCKFVDAIKSACAEEVGYLLADPHKRSACKRLMLMLRWLIRKDSVDPGGWENLGKEKLIIPLDTHMYQIATIMKMTSRKSADMKTAMEITAGFAKICPEDPTKYDFSLTRLGIRDDMNIRELNRLMKSPGLSL